jgi:hypothetical protein
LRYLLIKSSVCRKKLKIFKKTSKNRLTFGIDSDIITITSASGFFVMLGSADPQGSSGIPLT